MLAVDIRGRIVYANPQVTATFGWSPEALEGEPIERLVPERLAERHVGHRKAYLRNPAARPMGGGLELVGLRQDGTQFPIEVSLAPLSSQRTPLVIATAVDITARTSLQEELALAHAELQRHADDLEQTSRELSLLARLGELLESCESLEEAYAVISSVAEPLFPDDAGALYVLDPSHAVAEAVAVWGNPPPLRRAFGPSDCWAMRRSRLHVVHDEDPELQCSHVEETNPVAALCEPLTAQAETFGLLHLQVRRRVGTKARAALLADRERLIQALGEQISLTLANIRLRATLREQSLRDPLTGLFNRRYLGESLERELRRGAREEYPLSLMILDLDHFKDLNDAFGHVAGDTVLREVGRILAELVRGDDIACRYGGEEFVVVLPKASLDDAHRRADALRDRVKHAQLDQPARLHPPVTVSIGVAAYPIHGASVDELILAADSALYRAKAEGRDRVVVAGDSNARAIEVSAG